LVPNAQLEQPGSGLLGSSGQSVARILFVDDESAILRLFGLVLESAGYEVTTALSAAEAKRKLSEQNFNLVITDVRMESPTAGFEVLRAARRISPTLPVALLTAFPIPTSDWKQAGADAFFVKGADVTRPMLEWISASLAAEKARAEDAAQQADRDQKQAS
jgi:DNA-binding NtrC family response regulator